jgi:hypothetical protein
MRKKIKTHYRGKSKKKNTGGNAKLAHFTGGKKLLTEKNKNNHQILKRVRGNSHCQNYTT